jgi:hypothetical protein
MYYRNFSRVMSKIILILLGTLILAGQAYSAPSDRTKSECKGPTEDVVVFDIQDPKNSQAHLLVVKNSTVHSIGSLFVGSGMDEQLPIADFTIPLRISGPTGWKAFHAFKEQGGYMNWVWLASGMATKIEPNAMVAGFHVELPIFPAGREGNVYPDGSQVRPVVVSQLPFQAILDDGTCLWGQVRALKP